MNNLLVVSGVETDLRGNSQLVLMVMDPDSDTSDKELGRLPINGQDAQVFQRLLDQLAGKEVAQEGEANPTQRPSVAKGPPPLRMPTSGSGHR